jgi:YfiH family protein
VNTHRKLLLAPEWGAPANVAAFVTTRAGGSSSAPYQTLNLAYHVGDDTAAVQANRRLLAALLPASLRIQWLQQVHGADVVVPVTNSTPDDPAEQKGDAIYISTAGVAGAVLTADCLPVFFADQEGSSAAVAHAGWRGLADGILENTLACFNLPPQQIVAWLGPAIGPCHFEIGEEVREVFLSQTRSYLEREEMSQRAFTPAGAKGKWMADLYVLARLRLRNAGVTGIAGGNYCTVCEQDSFYSYRRDGVTGRMASLIYLKPH